MMPKMICDVCGEDCRCGAVTQAPDAMAGFPDVEDLSERLFEASLDAEARADNASEPEIAQVEMQIEPAAAPDPDAWRREVAARLQRYRARRKPKPPHYPSLWLEFEKPETPAAMRPASLESVARDEFAEPGPAISAVVPAVHEVPVPAKILAFPRSSAAPPAPVQELADPVASQPRILEVAEAPAAPPALGGITMSAPSDERRIDEQFRVSPASIPRRLFAAIVDALVVTSAGALGGAIFWQIAGVRPPGVQLAGIIAGALVVFWAVYQYSLIVYSGQTPGLWLAGLELVRLSGAPATRSRRRWRVLASFLSAASLGLGYLWALIETDSLAWHDRMTGTCIALKTKRTLP